MAKPKGNFIIIGGVTLLALLVAGAILFRIFGPAEFGQRTAKTQGASDTPVETLTSLSSQLTDVKKELEERQQQLEAEKNAAQAQSGEMVSKLQKDIQEANASLLSGINSRLESFDRKLRNMRNSEAKTSDYEVQRQARPGEGVLRSDGRIWFSPPGAQSSATDSRVKTLKDRLSDKFGEMGKSGILPAGSGSNKQGEFETNLPVYTIPGNATLMGSTAMTAIIGRVPVGGLIRDPIPFKVITGADNLAANNMYLPEVKEAVWSGIASGDGALKCSTGKITSVTFVFKDGTVVTQNARDKETGLGWISNDQGYPCIPGTYVSNAPEVMRKLFGAGFATGAANAFAQAQTETITTSGGAIARTVTGDTGEFALAQGFSAGFNEWARYVAERARDMFDAVVVDPGIKLAINMTEPVMIDYDTNGRKLRHLAASRSPDSAKTNSGGLD